MTISNSPSAAAGAAVGGCADSMAAAQPRGARAASHKDAGRAAASRDRSSGSTNKSKLCRDCTAHAWVTTMAEVADFLPVGEFISIDLVRYELAGPCLKRSSQCPNLGSFAQLSPEQKTFWNSSIKAKTERYRQHLVDANTGIKTHADLARARQRSAAQSAVQSGD